MNRTEKELINIAHQWLQQGFTVYFITVLDTWGSSPRPAGSIAVVRQDGWLHGSVSGGCVEEDLIVRLCSSRADDRFPMQWEYGSGADSRVSLPCGAVLNLFVERLQDPLHFWPLTSSLENSDSEPAPVLCRQVSKVSGQVQWLKPGTDQSSTDQSSKDFIHSEHYIQKSFATGWRLVLFGNSPVAQCLARFAQEMDYETYIVDPRPAYGDRGCLSVRNFSIAMPDDFVRMQASHDRTAYVTLSHDARVDDMALMEALTTDAFYIAALGSRRTQAARIERLRILGLTEAQISRLCAPAGLAIGSKTPEEIAVSILAEFIQKKNTVSLNINLQQAVCV